MPHVILLAGPNGAGKSTMAPTLLKDTIGVVEFVNADTIAQGLSEFDPITVALAAGKIMLERLEELAQMRVSFAFETTLATRSLYRRLQKLIQNGYEFHLIFLWLESADLAVARVAARVRMGGHSIPESIIRRRYSAGLRNFFSLYQPLANSWRMYNNS
ncbi:MAG: zeta toxin family protein, partial [Phycisphaerae bacterium]|nr:zeta toxin family protein [Phycisphaerae bacterium]